MSELIITILGFIVRVFLEIIVQEIIGGIFFGIFKLVYWIGLLGLKLITISSDSMEELGVKYKDSSLPYFMGFGILIGIIHLLF